MMLFDVFTQPRCWHLEGREVGSVNPFLSTKMIRAH